MAKQKDAFTGMSVSAKLALEEACERLTLGRKRRRASQRDWAVQLGLSQTTIIRMERAQPEVASSAYIAALRAIGAEGTLAKVAPLPADDPLREDPLASAATLAGLGFRLAAYRRNRDQSQVDAAAAAGCSETTIVRMESGRESVAFGVYLLAIEQAGELASMAHFADPMADEEALALHLDEVRSRVTVRAGAPTGRRVSAFARY